MTDSVFTVGTGNNFPLSLEFVDAHGNVGVAPAGFTPAWVSDHPELLTVSPNADMTASAVTVGPSGVATVTVTDSAGSALTGTLAVTIEAGVITGVTIVPGTPVANA